MIARYFISHGEDTKEQASSLLTALAENFPWQRVADAGDRSAGFADAAAASSVLVAVVGPQPKAAEVAAVETALRRGMHVVIALAEGADVASLPQALRVAAERHSVELRLGSVERLLAVLRDLDAESILSELLVSAARRGVYREPSRGDAGTAIAAPAVAPPPSPAAAPSAPPAVAPPPPPASTPPARAAPMPEQAPATAYSSAPGTAAPPSPVAARPPLAGPTRRASPWPRIALAAAALGAIGAGLAKLLGLFTFPGREISKPDDVTCTVFGPPTVARGESVLVQVFAHLPLAADDARALATEFDPCTGTRGYRTLETPVPRGATLGFVLRVPGAELDTAAESLAWHGRTESTQFVLTVPANTAATALFGTVTVSLDSIPIGHVKFKIAVHAQGGHAPPDPVGEAAKRYTSAFVSYASEDRSRVLDRVQMLRLAGIRWFQDVLELEPGDRWERELYRAIDGCDVFLLFWSRAARDSEYVRREVRYALTRQAGDELNPPEIQPVILDGPPVIEPWEELAHLHFDDRLVYFRRELST